MSKESAILPVLQQLTAGQDKSEEICQSVREGLGLFCRHYQEQRNFSSSPNQPLFKKLVLLVTREWLREDWLLPPSEERRRDEEEEEEKEEQYGGFLHAALMTLRLLLRDVEMQHVLLAQNHALPTLAGFLAQVVALHFNPSDSSPIRPHPSVARPHPSLATLFCCAVDLLKELTNIFQKISNTAIYREQLIGCDVHTLLVQLLWSHDLVALQCSLSALINLCKTGSVCGHVSMQPVVVPLFHIVTTYDVVSRHLAADLLLLLSQQSSFKQQVQDCDSFSTCLSVLHSDDLHVLHRVVGVIEGLLGAPHFQEEIRQLGGIPLLLNILKQQVLSEDCSGHVRGKIVALQAVCCAAITGLLLDDHNTQLVAQGNGVFLIATNIIPPKYDVPTRLLENLQRHALRALRYLFSMERNRRVFKKMFPPDLFVTFIDIGHYNSRLSAYSKLVHTINTLSETDLATMTTNIEGVNQDHAPLFSLAGYVVLDLLGAGSFGSVYKVRRRDSDQLYAMKEIRSSHPCLGRTLDERSASLKKLFNEVEITREHLRHPNIVLYHKCFQEGDHLYIVMELLEGAPLSDYIASMEEKGSRFSEDRLWRIFIQLLQALRYLHKDKNIIHRDLSPANLMLNEDDKLTITDFGLAKLKGREFSVMKSVVGTMLYWCPELVESEPYTETADVWAAGCILYQMAMLRPPFLSSNLLALAKKIVEVTYDPIPAGSYSPLVGEVVASCLTADPALRPDTVKLGAQLAGVLMAHMDSLSSIKETLERRLAKEKQRTVRHYHKALTSERRYHQLLSASSSTTEDHAQSSVDTSSPSARRQLSSAFTSAQQLHSAERHLDPLECDASLECGTPLQGEESEDPLKCSSGSVFAADTVSHTRNWEQPASPQVVVRGHGKPSPPTSHISSSPSTRLRKQSSGDVILPSHVQRVTRRPSAPARTPSWSSAPLNYHNSSAPLSPLAAGRKSRTPSASSMVSISPKHLREVNDPILSLLTPLHKLLFLTQLPPSPTPSARRTLTLQYKQHLFSAGSSPPDLKVELHQLASASTDVVRLFDASRPDHRGGGAHLVQHTLKEMREVGGAEEVGQGEDTITYSLLQQMIEGLAVETGYYSNKHYTEK